MIGPREASLTLPTTTYIKPLLMSTKLPPHLLECASFFEDVQEARNILELSVAEIGTDPFVDLRRRINAYVREQKNAERSAYTQKRFEEIKRVRNTDVLDSDDLIFVSEEADKKFGVIRWDYCRFDIAAIPLRFLLEQIQEAEDPHRCGYPANKAGAECLRIPIDKSKPNYGDCWESRSNPFSDDADAGVWQSYFNQAED
jgi:hypothetical protein